MEEVEIVHKILGIESGGDCYDVDLDLFYHGLKESPDLPAPQDRLTSAQRVDYVFKQYKLVVIQREENKRFCKNATVSSKLREIGNEYYKKKDLSKALEWYNVALMFAPKGYQEAGLGYAKRSAVLVELGHPEEALEDVELALQNNYPDATKCKLENRRRKCKELIDQRNEKRHEKGKKAGVDEKVRKRQKMRDEMLQIINPNPRIPQAANFVTIKYDDVMGRKLVVTEDVPAGTVLLVSEPYVTAFNYTEGWVAEHCHHCLKRIHRGIPCQHCVFAFYCNESCRQEAREEYHKFECPIMDCLHWEDEWTILAVRIVCKAGPHNLFKLYQSQDPSYFSPVEPYGVGEDCVFNEDPYLAVYHMMSHSEKFSEAEQANYKKSYIAFLLTVMLESRTAFFQEIPNIQRADFMKFVATLIRHHIDSFLTNPTPIFEMKDLDGMTVADFFTDESDSLIPSRKINSPVAFARGMYPLESLKNHSCDPNVFFVNDVTKGKKITIASRALKAGEVLFGNYLVNFMDYPLKYRQQVLEDKFFFTCECVACVNNWPTLQHAPGGVLLPVVQFCCPICSVKYSTVEKASADFQEKCGLNEAGSWKCASCAKQYSEDTLQALYVANVKMVEEADKACQRNDPCDTHSKILKATEFFQSHLCPPWYAQSSAERTWSQALFLLFHTLSRYD